MDRPHLQGQQGEGVPDGLVAEGGGDWEEAVKDGFEAAMKQLKWRPDAKKVIILVGSSPPHEKDLPALRQLVAQWQARGGVVSAIDVSQRLHEQHERKLHRWLYGEELKKPSRRCRTSTSRYRRATMISPAGAAAWPSRSARTRRS